MDLINEFGMIIYLIICQFKLIFPYWLTGLIAGSLISVFAFDGITVFISKMNNERYGLLTIVPASLLGAASPICMYGTIPLIVSLGKKGVPQYLLAALMVSSILINPNLFVFSFYLGMPLALLRLFISLLAGVVAGLLVKLFYQQKKLFDFNGFAGNKKSNSRSKRLIEFLKDLNRAIAITAPYFLIGILLAALFERYFPKNLIINSFGPNKGLGVLMAASLGIPVYVCGGGTIPLIKAWLDMGMSPGSATAFMISGPATKITNLSALKIILGARNFVFYIVYCITFSIISGLIVDLIYLVVR